MNAHTSKSGSGLMVPMAPRAVRTFAATLGGAPGGAPVGPLVLPVAGAARPRSLLGQVMVRPSTAPSYEAPCPGSYSTKMDSHWGMHSNLRPERYGFTHPLSPSGETTAPTASSASSAPPPGPEKTLACVKSPAPFGSAMGDRGLPAKGFFGHAPPPPVPPGPPLPLVADEVPQHAPECPAQGGVSHLRARKKGGIGGVPALQRSLPPGEGQHVALVGLVEAPGIACLPPQPRGRNQNAPPPPPPMPRPRPRPSPP